MDASTLATILSQSRRNNEQLGVSGALLFSDGSFFQVLEGEASAVDELYITISRDPRHSRAVTIIREPIARRTFGEWTMGSAELSQRDVIETAGMNNFLGQGSLLHQLDQGRARKLLTAFTQGRWRSRLSESDRSSTTAEPLADTRAP
jgi:hypothetical protein